jgi:hypothetical protein
VRDHRVDAALVHQGVTVGVALEDDRVVLRSAEADQPERCVVRAGVLAELARRHQPGQPDLAVRHPAGGASEVHSVARADLLPLSDLEEPTLVEVHAVFRRAVRRECDRHHPDEDDDE